MATTNILEYLVENYQYEEWDWFELHKNPNMSFKFMFDFLDKFVHKDKNHIMGICICVWD